MYPIWHWCLDNGLNLYIEKPMGLTMHHAESARVPGRGESADHPGEPPATDGTDHAAGWARLLEKGPIVHAVVEFFKCDITPMLGARDRMMDDGTHAVDTARWICGGEVIRVESECRRIGVPDINWFGATLHFDNGATCYVVCSWASGRRVFRTQMHVPGGYADVEVEAEAKVYLDNNYEGETLTTEEAAGSDKNFIFGGFAAKNRRLLNSLKTGEQLCSSPFRDTVKTMRVCQAILGRALEPTV